MADSIGFPKIVRDETPVETSCVVSHEPATAIPTVQIRFRPRYGWSYRRRYPRLRMSAVEARRLAWLLVDHAEQCDRDAGGQAANVIAYAMHEISQPEWASGTPARRVADAALAALTWGLRGIHSDRFVPDGEACAVAIETGCRVLCAAPPEPEPWEYTAPVPTFVVERVWRGPAPAVAREICSAIEAACRVLSRPEPAPFVAREISIRSAAAAGCTALAGDDPDLAVFDL